MMINKWFNKIQNERGGALILTMMGLSVIIFLFIAMASFSLSQTIAHVNRTNAKIQQIEVAQDIAQAVARAHTLGKSVTPPDSGSCPTGTTKYALGVTPNIVNFCFPSSGVLNLGGVGMTGVCVDLDQNTASTNDRYCLNNLVRVTKWTEPKDENPSFIAKISEKFSRSFTNFVINVESSFAQCTWYDCPEPTHGAAETTSATVSGITPPAAFVTEPAGAAVQSTGGTLAANNSLEPWFPDPTWGNTNEIYTPACGAANQYWLGCVNCALAAFQCFEFTICPVGEACTTTSDSTNIMRQGLAFY